MPKGKWIEELPKVVWSHNTTVSRTTGFMPFRLLYGEEAMLLEEARMQSLRVTKRLLALNEEYLKKTIEGDCLQAVDNINAYQKQTKS